MEYSSQTGTWMAFSTLRNAHPAGTIKRYGMKRGAMTHGSKSHREHGSTGPGTTPGRTFPGLKMAGHMGAVRRKCRSLQVSRRHVQQAVILKAAPATWPRECL